MKQILLLYIFFISITSAAQTPCTAPGQNPNTAFPVCGTSSFSQASVPLCGGKVLPAPCNTSGGLYTDINPFWYKFTCFQSGTLGFRITPNNMSSDYDWQLYDITGRNPMDVYSVNNLYIASNWSGESGVTGASPAGTQLLVCGGFGQPLFSKMPDLVAGHDYLLLVSHFTNTQSGYSLSFTGGTAVITDSTPPQMQKADASCTGSMISLKLNKKMKCSSIAANGSDFFITPGGANVISATGTGCNTGFDTDSLIVQLNQALVPGSYVLNIKKGSDNNTILDYCDNAITENSSVNFVVLPQVPTSMDSMMKPSCKMQSVKLIFSKPIACNSIASDGSDFIVNGSYPVTVTSASGSCANGLTKEITVNLDKPLLNQGNFTISLRNGSDGNTLLNECALPTPAGSSLNFAVQDTVNADFTYVIQYGCTVDTVNYFHPGANGVNQWNWILDESKTSNAQNPQALYSVFNTKNVQLFVSNGFCVDSSAASVALKNFLKADFFVHPNNCPNEATLFTSKAEGMIARHRWTFGDGGTSDSVSPSHIYQAPLTRTTYNVTYTITDSIGCEKSITKPTTIYTSCLIAIPSGFTPNGDGKNDIFYPLNAVKADNLKFLVYNRYGQLIFQTNDWLKGWNGTFKGIQQQPGVYVWLLQYTNRDTGEVVQQKGTVVLIR